MAAHAAPPMRHQMETGEMYIIALDLGTTRSALSVWVEKGDYSRNVGLTPDTRLTAAQPDCKTETVILFSSEAILGTTDNPVTIDSPVTNAKYETAEGWVHIGQHSVFDAEEWVASDASRKAYFIREFKMELDLQSKRVKDQPPILLKDIEVTAYALHDDGDPIRVNLRQVMTAYIACAAKIAFDQLKVHIQNTKDPVLAMPSKDDVNWVITVPAIWTDQARIFMRELMHAAGLSDDPFSEKISICLEPEGAVLEAVLTRYIQNPAFLRDRSILVVDWGGGTCDVTFSKVTSTVNDRVTAMEEIAPPIGGPYGGQMINQMIDEAIFRPWFGEELYEKRWVNKGYRYRFFRQHLESKKIGFAEGTLWQFKFYDLFQGNLPELRAELAKFNEGRTDSEKLQSAAPLKGPPVFKIPASMIKQYFDRCIESVLKLIDPLVNHPTSPPELIFVVGGMAQSPYVRTSLLAKLPKGKVVFPENASMAVVSGAVRSRLYPVAYEQRRARTNYGILFRQDVYQMWNTLLSKGDLLRNIDAVTMPIYTPQSPTAETIRIQIYECPERIANRAPVDGFPIYLVAQAVLKVNMSVPYELRRYRVQLSMEGSALSGNITDLSTGNVTKIKWGSN